MENILIYHTSHTPFVNLDFQKGIFSFSGYAQPLNGVDFFVPIIDSLKEYVQSPLHKHHYIVLKLYHMSKSAIVAFIEIFNILESLHFPPKHAVNLKWFYRADDLDMEDEGKNFEWIVPFYC